MLTLFHSPKSRSSRVVAQIIAMGIEDQVDIRTVEVRRQDGTGAADPANPHPEGKVPLLVHDGVEIWESAAIMLYLTELFPQSDLGVPVGDAQRGRYLAWMAWYGSVLEPVGIFGAVGVEHPALHATFRSMKEAVDRLKTALAAGPWLVAERFTAADMLIASMFIFYGDAMPSAPAIRDWVARCAAHPCWGQAAEFEAKVEAEAD